MSIPVGSWFSPLKLCGAGEWLIEKHGTKRHRAWRVLHLATDADTGRIVASVLTDTDADDGSQVGPLLDRIDAAAGAFTRHGAFDRDEVHAKVAARHPTRPLWCRHARTRCRATPRRLSGMFIYDALPSAGAWAGRGCQGTTSALWWRLTSRDGGASSVTGCASRRTGDRRSRWPSRSTY